MHFGNTFYLQTVAFFIPNLLLFPYFQKVMCCLDFRIPAKFSVSSATDIMNKSLWTVLYEKIFIKKGENLFF